MHKKTIISLFLLIISTCSYAGDIGSIIERVVQENPTLKKYRAQTDAIKAGNHIGLTLPDPEVEFNYLWGSPNDVGQRKDISITQHFDYATLFGVKRKEAKAKDELAEIQYAQATLLMHQEVLKKVAEIAFYNELMREYDRRIETAEKLADRYKAKMNAGEANKIEVNKILLNLATIRSEAAETEMERTMVMKSSIFQNVISETQERELLDISMNEIEKYTQSCRLTSLIQMERDKADKGTIASMAEIRSAKAKGLPELTAGYMAELTRQEKFRGLTFGLSIPLWSNRKNVNHAKSQLEALKAENEESMTELLSQRNALIAKMQQLNAFKESLSKNISSTSNESLLSKALNEGEISMLEYLSDRESYYELKLKLINVQKEYVMTLIDSHLCYDVVN